MNNPNDPWRRPGEESTDRFDEPTAQYDRPTEQYNQPTEQYNQPTEQYGWGQPQHTANPYEAYGEVPPPNATAAYPTLSGYDPMQQQSQPYQNQPYQGYYGEVPPLEQSGGGSPEGPHKSRTWMVVLAIVGILALLGVGAAVLFSDTDSSSTDTAAPQSTRSLPRATTVPRRSTEPQQSPEPTAPPETSVPGLGGIGAAMGKISANDGSTLTVDGLTGGSTTVKTNASTQVIALSGDKVSDLKVGDSVVIQGDKQSDGTILAKQIISISLPDFGGFGNPPR